MTNETKSKETSSLEQFFDSLSELCEPWYDKKLHSTARDIKRLEAVNEELVKAGVAIIEVCNIYFDFDSFAPLKQPLEAMNDAIALAKEEVIP